MAHSTRLRACALAALLASCGGAAGVGGGAGGGEDAGVDAGTPDGGPGPFAIKILDFTFSPTNLTVPAGATITVINLDASPHSVTSEKAPGDLRAGVVNGVSFDTGPFLGQTTIAIPVDAPSGTIIPYFSTVDLGAMKNQPQLTIQ